MKETILVLQGAGALGAYECGVYKALEEKGIRPDVVVGASMGAINAAIIASHPPGNAALALEALWSDIGVATPSFPHEGLRRLTASYQALFMGVPNCFVPRWLNPYLNPWLPISWTSFYDRRPLKRLLERHVDFEYLPSSKTRLILTAVNVETGELEVFDTRTGPIGPDHIIASGSSPPEFAWTQIDGRVFWDGTLGSNTPLRPVLERMVMECIRNKTEVKEKKVYMVDQPSTVKSRPRNLLQVLDRQKEILYSDKVQRDIRECQMVNDALVLIKNLLAKVDDAEARKVRESQIYKRFVGQSCWVDVTRIDHTGEDGEYYPKHYDFSRKSIQQHQALGYQKTHVLLAKETSHATH